MVWTAMLALLVNILLVSHGVLSLVPKKGGSLDLPWHDVLCCDSSAGHPIKEEEQGRSRMGSVTNESESDHPLSLHCKFSSSTSASQLHINEPSGDACLDSLCRIDEKWENVICDLKSHTRPTGTSAAPWLAVSLQRLVSHEENPEMKAGDGGSDSPVVCEGEDSVVCSITLSGATGFIAVLNVNISNVMAPPVLLHVPPNPAKPSPPVNLTHAQTIEGQLFLSWTDLTHFGTGPLSCEVRYNSNSTPVWQFVYVSGESSVPLDLKPRLNYTLQARCSSPGQPRVWSDWSQPYHIYLDTVSYIPEKVVVRAGENVTVYCVFNDLDTNASMAVWILNFNHQLPHSQSSLLNRRVSQVTMRPSQKRMYDLLQCTQEWNIPYSLIYVEGAAIDISCQTNGDIDAMTCSWENTQWTKLTFQSRWADLPCDVMEERERAGEEVGEMGASVCSGRLGERVRSCKIEPLRMNCYKLWLELHSPLGPVRSRPIYVSPTDHVKPHIPSNVKAVTQASGALLVTWEPPSLPVEGVQCQFRYHSTSTVRAQPEWRKIQSPTRVAQAEVAVSVTDMCRVYVVQVRCMPASSTGHWSGWTESVYSTPQNRRAPEHGPDFWRILVDDPYRNQTNVTLLFKHPPIGGHSYCVNGLVVEHQDSGGTVTSEQIEQVASYSFEWSQEVHTVTVKAYNSLGSSTSNIKMTLNRQPKRHCVRSFCVMIVNSTCASLSWSLMDNSSVPVAMVVQWSALRLQDADRQNSQSWVRLPYAGRTLYLRGDFFGSEEYGFTLYPVFADGEGEPVFTTASRGNPAAYMLLMIITFLSVVLFVTLVLSQNRMKKFVWKDVPNPNNCSWAKGLDFKKGDTIDHLFPLPEGVSAWPLLLSPSENISEAVIVGKTDLLVPATAMAQVVALSLAPRLISGLDQPNENDRDGVQIEVSLLDPTVDPVARFQPTGTQPDHLTRTTDSSAQSSVTYATVLMCNPERDQQATHHGYKDGSGSSSSDEGNFSANNSDISGSFHGGLWELESSRGGEADDPRRSCSYNSVASFSEGSEQEEDEGMREEKDLYYLGMDYPREGEEEGEESERENSEEEAKIVLLRNKALSIEDCPVESDYTALGSGSVDGFTPLYRPQFRAAPGKL